MALPPDKQAFLDAQAPPDPAWGGTGAVYRAPDPADWSALLHPGIARALQQGVTSATLLQAVTGPSYNQGTYGACVAASTCSDGSVAAVMNGQPWPVFSWIELYQENGGVHDNGVDTQQVLRDVIAQGLPLASGSRVKELSSYLWVPQTPGLFRQTMIAAFAAGEAVTLALLLPSSFGWSSSGARTQGYHQLLAVAGDPTWCTIFNSWGDQWPGPGQGAPRGGLGRIPWDYIEADNLQNGFAYACLTTRVQVNPVPFPTPQPGPQPLPTPQPLPGPGPTPNPSPQPVPAGLTVNIQMDDGRRGAARLTLS